MANPTEQVSATKALILRQAEQLFARHGYDGTSMHDIAQACHLTKANLYYYFKDKEALYVEVLEADMVTLIRALDEASEQGATCREKISDITRVFMQLLTDKDTLILMTIRSFSGLEHEIRGLVSRYRTELVRPIERALEEGIQRGEVIEMDPRTAAMALIGMMSIYLAPPLLGMPMESMGQEIAPRLVQFYFDGIAKR